MYLLLLCGALLNVKEREEEADGQREPLDDRLASIRARCVIVPIVTVVLAALIR